MLLNLLRCVYAAVLKVEFGGLVWRQVAECLERQWFRGLGSFDGRTDAKPGVFGSGVKRGKGRRTWNLNASCVEVSRVWFQEEFRRCAGHIQLSSPKICLQIFGWRVTGMEG